MAEAHNNLGNVLRAQGKLDEALVQCERAVALKPDHFEPLHNLGFILGQQGKLEQAVAAYRRRWLSIRTLPAHTIIWPTFSKSRAIWKKRRPNSPKHSLSSRTSLKHISVGRI